MHGDDVLVCLIEQLVKPLKVGGLDQSDGSARERLLVGEHVHPVDVREPLLQVKQVDINIGFKHILNLNCLERNIQKC